MSQIIQAFQPPLYWQQFEDLTAAVFSHVYGDNRPQKVGRSGQTQNGVDVVGRYVRTNELIGIQCKRMEERDANNQPYPGGVITEKLLLEEFDDAKAFQPHLDEWVLATTAKRDEKIQGIAREVSERSVKSGSFRVSVWSWDEYVADLNRYHDLQAGYYRSVLNVHSRRDQDVLIVDLFAHAFSRPAFEEPLYDENPDDFLQSISDTQRAMNLGELVDRVTRNIIRRTVGGRRAIQNREWLKTCDSVYRGLIELKKEFKAGLRDETIKPHGGFVRLEPAVQHKLEIIRAGCVADLNQVLKLAGLRKIGC